MTGIAERFWKPPSVLAERAAARLLRWSIPLARSLSRRRLRRGCGRSLWGVTPIVTLPLLARCDRMLGLRAETAVNTTYYISRNFSWNLEWPIRIFRRLGLLATFDLLVLTIAILRYDVFHYFNDRGLVSSHFAINPAELDALAAAGKRLYVSTYGADIRTRERTLALGRWNFCSECPEPGRFCVCDDTRGKASLAAVAARSSAVMSMADMTVYAPGCVNMHYWPIDTDRLACAEPRPVSGPLRVAHAPNHPHFKGTRFLEVAIGRLQQSGAAIELVRIQGVPNSEVIKLFASADIVADQFIGGAYGYTALEAMAQGKPVLAFVRDRTAVMAAESCPILQTEPETVEAVLRWCLANRARLPAIGLQGRRWVEMHHSLPAVAARLARLYLDTGAFPLACRRAFEAALAAESRACPRERRQRQLGPPLPDSRRASRGRRVADGSVGLMLCIGVEPSGGEPCPVSATGSATAYVLSLSHIPRDGRVRRHCRDLTAAGWRVVAIGLTAPDGSSEELDCDAVRHVTLPFLDWSPQAKLKAALALLGARLVAHPERLPALPRCLPGVAAISDRLDIEIRRDNGPAARMLIVANDWMTLPAALAAKISHGIPFHYDTHEIAPEEHAQKLSWRLLFPPLVRAIEREGLRLASSVSCVSPGIAQLMKDDYRLAQLPHVIMSLPDTAPLPPTPPGQTLSVLYHGLFAPGRGLEKLIAAAGTWPDGTVLVLRGQANDPAYQRRIVELALPGVAAGRLLLQPLAAPRCILGKANTADLGVFLPDLDGRQNQMALPNKLFEYLYAGLPPVAPAKTEMARLLATLQCGFILDAPDPALLTQCLAGLTRSALVDAKRAAHEAAVALHATRYSSTVSACVGPPPAIASH